MTRKKLASFAEQLAELSNPAPSLDPEDVESDAEAKVVDFDDDSSDGPAGGQQPSRLRKLTTVPLSEADKRYAGKSSSRNSWLADSDSDDISREDEASSMEEEEVKEFGCTDDEPRANEDDLMHHFNKISAQIEDSESDGESDDGADEEDEKVTHTTSAPLRKNADNEDDESEEESEEDVESDAEELKDGNKDDNGFSEEDDFVKPFSQGSVQEDVERGQATKCQMGLWDSLLKTRITLQKALSLTNQIPQHDTLDDFIECGEVEVQQALSKSQEELKKLVSSMIELQDTLLLQNPETLHVVEGSNPASSSKPSGNKRISSNVEEIPSDDEEIPSDDEEIPSDDEEIPSNEEIISDDEEVPSDDEDISSEAEIRINKIKKRGKHSANINQSRATKRPIEESEFGGHLAKRHKDFEQYRNTAIQKWHDRTKLSAGKMSKSSFSSFDKTPVAQIQQVLQDKDRLIKRTQLRRTAYKVLGKLEDKEEDTEEDQDMKSSHNIHLKDYDSEIFNDDDFYHQLLRELIDKKTIDSSDPIQLTRQWLEVQKLRSKVKKRVDTKASKGRKLRYEVHKKLVSYMAPYDSCIMMDDARNELYDSLFGQRKSNQAIASQR